MSFNWSELLVYADRLREDPRSELQLRTAINRAYYAALNEARKYAKQHYGLKIATTAGSSHQQVWTCFRSNRRSDIVDLANKLKVRRTDADYQDIFPGRLGREAEAAVSDAEELIRLLTGKGPVEEAAKAAAKAKADEAKARAEQSPTNESEAEAPGDVST